MALTLDPYVTGEALARQRIHREHPELAATEVEAQLLTWLATRTGAENGDASGRRISWPRNKDLPRERQRLREGRKRSP